LLALELDDLTLLAYANACQPAAAGDQVDLTGELTRSVDRDQ